MPNAVCRRCRRESQEIRWARCCDRPICPSCCRRTDGRIASPVTCYSCSGRRVRDSPPTSSSSRMASPTELCQSLGCCNRAAGGRCPCCTRPVCPQHCDEHALAGRAKAEGTVAEMEKLEQQMNKSSQHCSVLREHLQSKKREWNKFKEEAIEFIERKDNEISQSFESQEKQLEDLNKTLANSVLAVSQLKSSLTDSLSEPFSEHLVQLTANAENIVSHTTLPDMPHSVQLTQEPQAMLHGLVELMKELRVESRPGGPGFNGQLRSVGLPSDDPRFSEFQPHVARVWQPAGRFCVLNGRVHFVDNASGGRRLRDEVILACSARRIFVLANNPDGSELLGELQVDAGVPVAWFDLAPSHRQLAVVSGNRVLVCEPDGRVLQRLGPFDNLAGVNFGARQQLLTVEAGVVESDACGCVRVWRRAPELDDDFKEAARIPVHGAGVAPIFPTAAVGASGGVFVLAKDDAGASALLVHDAEGGRRLAVKIDDIRAPTFACCDERGYVYVADTDNCRVAVFSPDATRLNSLDNLGVASCHGISIWHEAAGNSSLVISDPAGCQVHFVSLREESSPRH